MKRIFSLFLALAMILPVLLIPVQAAETSGSCGDSAVWSYDDSVRTLTITVQNGSSHGAIDGYYDYYNQDQPWAAYQDRIRKVIIGEGITSIGAYAFENHTALTGVTLPNSLTEICDRAFSGCTKLQTINLPAGITHIREGALANCSSLKSAALPGSLVYLGSSAFKGCRNLTSVVVPAGVTVIQRSTFSDCIRLSSVKLHNSITKIDAWAFYGCSALKSITLPNKLTCIYSFSFSNSGLTSILIPEGVTTIESSAFDSCNRLLKVTLPNSIRTIGNYAFYQWQNTIGNVHYNGTREERNAITIGTYNTSLKSAVWHYNKMPAPVVTASMDEATGCPALTWGSVKNATGYQIFRSTAKDGEYKKIGTTTSTSYLDSEAKAGARYYYKVRATSSDNKSAFSSVVNCRAKLKTPTVSGSTALSGAPKISWKKVNYATSYTVYRASESDGTYKEIGSTTKLYYSDKTATAGQTWYYKVQACRSNSSASSDLSNSDSALCVLSRPVVKISLSKKKPLVKWAQIEGADHYEVYRAVKKTGAYKLLSSTDELKYADTTAKAGKTYYYKVIAVHSNSSLNSSLSAAKSIKSK